MTNTPYIPTDRFEELDRIDLDQVFNVLETYCHIMLPDMEACQVYLLRILRDEGAKTHPKTHEWVSRLIRKIRDFGPLHPQGLNLAHKLTRDPVLDARLERLNYFSLTPDLLDLRSVLSDQRVMQRKRDLLNDVLQKMPGHVLAASQLLTLDYYEGIDHADWLDNFTPPKFFQDEWKQRLFIHYAGLSVVDRALELWPMISSNPVSEIQLNLAAELFVKSGNTPHAIALYEQSLLIDPQQTPIALRVAELKDPFQPDHSLLTKKDVTICLYSWNKADDLRDTLFRLAQTDIGNARIRILLNGCTDHSAQVVEDARPLFPNNDFGVETCLVNVGAPAARNWLGALPEVRASEYVAYLDDDVELPADWLAHFITIMEKEPETAVVGCKVVFSQEPRMIQYLHRRFTLAEPGMIKLTDPNQIAQMDYGQYDYISETDNVMGCCHLLRMAHMPDGPQFDLRYSPSQVDDIAHDIQLRVDGHKIRYCGLVRCIHHQNTGTIMQRKSKTQTGQVLGNDMKFYFYFEEHLERIREILKNSRT